MITINTEKKVLERSRGSLRDKILTGITHGWIGIEFQKTQAIRTVSGIPKPEFQTFIEVDFLELAAEPFKFDEATYGDGTTTYLLPKKNKHVVVFDWKVFKKKSKTPTS
ncbi:MAG: hypothetical protein AAB569_06780 [Patescibacteria group bacterium]